MPPDQRASKLEPEEDGVAIDPELEDDFEKMLLETDADEAAGRGVSWERFRKDLPRLIASG